MFDSNGFEIKSCGRCGGSGRHSYCERYGDRCFECGGKGNVFTKRGAEAHRFFSDLFEVPIETIKVGDWVKLTGYTKAKVLAVKESIQRGSSNGVPYESPVVVLTINTSTGLLHSSNFKGSTVKKLESESIHAERLVAAMEYQATLTKQGKVRKVRKPVVLLDLDKFLTGYIECALWSSTDDNDEPLDLYDEDDIDPTVLETMRADCQDFIKSNAKLLNGLDAAQCGHDFWLTRNRHGAGFWDRGLGDVGQQLTEACRPYGEFNLYEAEGVIHGQ
jgi:hypothetical protein